MADQVMKTGDEIEAEISEKLKPFAPRPHVYPSPVRSPVDDDTQKWRESRAEPDVRSLTRLLLDIEKIADQIDAKVGGMQAHMAEILKVTNERLARLEKTIGVQNQ